MINLLTTLQLDRLETSWRQVGGSIVASPCSSITEPFDLYGDLPTPDGAFSSDLPKKVRKLFEFWILMLGYYIQA